ncbi:hypothetical protein K438DRAFT_1749848 [Mycena galopus ATCC 62051]|nr:hypothetical protein K438DRAFT_1749848 [Mycena galopus ATCC 62051]
MQVKVGHAKDFEKRQHAYAKCAVDWVLISQLKLWTPHRMLLEALVHETLRWRGAAVRRVRCSCSTRHREFWNFFVAGGIGGVQRITLGWMYLLGQTRTHTTFL